jgi:hypothetical protein
VTRGHNARERGCDDDRVGEARPLERDGRLALAHQGLACRDGCEVRLELRFRRAQLVAVLAEGTLGRLDERIGRLRPGARLVDVAGRDEILRAEGFGPFELAPPRLGVGARLLDLGRARSAAIAYALESGAARVGDGAGLRKTPPGCAEIRRQLTDGEVGLAAIQICERLPLPHRIAQIRVKPDDRAGDRGAREGFLPCGEPPDRVDAPLDGAARDPGGRDAKRRGLGGARATLPGAGRPRLRASAARKQKREQQAGGGAHAGGGDAAGYDRGRHGTVAFIVDQGVVQ